jgi:hypothetical protein
MRGSGALHSLRTRVDESVGMSLIRAVTGRRESHTDHVARDAGPAATSVSGAERSLGTGASFLAAPHTPRRIVTSGEIAPAAGRGQRSGRATGRVPTTTDDARLRLWRDSALLLFGALLVALVGINLLPPAGGQGGVAGATGTPDVGAPLVVGPVAPGSASASASAGGAQTAGHSPSPNGSPGPSPKPAGAPASSTTPGSSTAPSTYRPATPTPNPTPKPTNHATPSPSPATAPSVRPSPTPTPTPSPSPTPTPSPSPTPTSSPSRTPRPSP